MFWNSLYFRYLTSSFGSTIFIADQNAKGNDRSSLRLMIQCYDPLRILETVVINREGKWTRCKVVIRGWSYEGEPPPGFQGPMSDGEMREMDEFVHNQLQEDSIRRSLMETQNSFRVATAAQLEIHLFHTRSTGQSSAPSLESQVRQNSNSCRKNRPRGAISLDPNNDKGMLRIRSLVLLPTRDCMWRGRKGAKLQNEKWRSLSLWCAQKI